MEIPILIYNSRTEIRTPAVNLLATDNALFEKEMSASINSTTLFKLSNVDILKTSVFNLKKLKFYPSFTHINIPKKRLLKKLLLFIKPYSSVEKAIWITDEWSAEYFHWLTDALCRLTALKSFGNTYKIILPTSYRNKAYVEQSLEILNYKIEYYNPSKRTRIKKLLLPSHTAPTGNYNTVIINELRNEFLKNSTDIVPTRNIYISRAKANNRKILNEDAVIALLLKYNYEIHFFEEYDLRKQIKIMCEAKSLIGLHGAGLTNMLFMHKGAKILELRNEGDSSNNCFFSMASALYHRYYYLTNKGDNENTFNVNINVNLVGLEKTLNLMNE